MQCLHFHPGWVPVLTWHCFLVCFIWARWMNRQHASIAMCHAYVHVHGTYALGDVTDIRCMPNAVCVLSRNANVHCVANFVDELCDAL